MTLVSKYPCRVLPEVYTVLPSRGLLRIETPEGPRTQMVESFKSRTALVFCRIWGLWFKVSETLLFGYLDPLGKFTRLGTPPMSHWGRGHGQSPVGYTGLKKLPF